MAIPKTLLGMPGPWADDYSELSDYYTSKIGGFPDWPIEEGKLIFLNLLDCRSCGSDLCLLAQVYAPISSVSLLIEERVIYIFGCVKPECGSDPLSWRALRVQNHQDREVPNMNVQEDEDAPSAAFSGSVQNTNWWEDLDDASTDDDVDLEELGKALSQAAISASSSKQQKRNGYSESSADPSPSRSVNRDRPVVPCFYVYTQEEPFGTELTRVYSNYSSTSIKETRADVSDDDRGHKETWEDESYEYDRALNADRTYLKFKKRIDACPEQCFRYSYGGKPLLATGTIKDPEKCSRCGVKRQFELQLMPQLLYFIQEQADKCHKHLFENWNWMTLIVYTCSKSCSNLSKHESCNAGWVIAEETVLVQLEQ